MLAKTRQFLEMIRFSHTVFALPFALFAALMAWIDPARERSWGWRELVGIVLCMIFARSAAMAFNRVADRKLDAQNPRTAGRHLPAGVLTAASVVAFAVLCSLAFVASTLMFLPNRLPLYLAVPVLLFLLAYSYTKRFTALAHFWLGAALAMAPVATWIALRGEIAWPPVVLGVAVLLWVAGFDMIYACQDVEVDRKLGLHSVPQALGVRGALRLAMVCHALMVAALAALPLVFPPLGAVYYAGIACVGLLLAYEHWLVRPDDLARVNVAFFNVNAVVSIGLLAIGAIDLLI